MTIGSVQAEKNMMEWIVEAETLADLVDGHWTASTKPLVRCKDCKYYWENTKANIGGPYFLACLASPNEDAFCSEGRRKDDDLS